MESVGYIKVKIEGNLMGLFHLLSVNGYLLDIKLEDCGKQVAINIVKIEESEQEE